MPTNEDIEHQFSLLKTYRRNLMILLNQEALHGPGFVPPIIVNSILIERENICRVKKNLRNWNQQVDDLPEDEDNKVSNTSSSISSLREIKVKMLRQRLEILYAQYQAASEQLLHTLSDADKVTLKARIASLEHDITILEHELKML